MKYPNRKAISKLIFEKIEDSQEALRKNFLKSKDQIGYFYLDDVLPVQVAKDIYSQFPSVEDISKKKSIKEYKYVTAQMDRYSPLLEEVLYAFQDDQVVDAISNICGYKAMYPDPNLYAGGLSIMGKNNYLKPHLDNSHDKDRKRWRVLNLLYYVTPDWKLSFGGNLELWPNGLYGQPTIIESRFNRLVVMATHQQSWHSVSEVKVDQLRCCISNYYFSDQPARSDDSFHVTTFRARPGHYFQDQVLRWDAAIRMGIRKIFRKGIKENPHVYKKGKNSTKSQ